MTTSKDHSEDDIALAGEYALHLMTADARRAFEKRLLDEPQLRALLREWDAGLVPMADEFSPVAPPRHVKAQIEKVLFEPAPRSFAPRWLSGLGFAAALVAVTFFVAPLTNRSLQFEPTLVSEMAAEDQSLIVTARYAPETGVLQIDRQAGVAPSDRSFELWLIADGAEVPVSLGVLSDQAVSDIQVPEALASLVAGGTLAISDEPLGGSPTGVATGAILAIGPVVEI